MIIKHHFKRMSVKILTNILFFTIKLNIFDTNLCLRRIKNTLKNKLNYEYHKQNTRTKQEHTIMSNKIML